MTHHHHAREYYTPLMAVLCLVAGIALIMFGLNDQVSAPPPPACRLQQQIVLTGPNGVKQGFTVDLIATVLANTGDYPANVHAVISSADNHQYGVREDVDTVLQDIKQAECQ